MLLAITMGDERALSQLKVESRGHELVNEIIYGPVQSRRFGQTLGINLLPAGKKRCNFECVYCQLGFAKEAYDADADADADTDAWPEAAAVTQLLHQKLSEPQAAGISALVFSGNGEPTLHPDFLEIVKAVLHERDKMYPDMRVLGFTNGTRLGDRAILQALAQLDECHLKIDPESSRVNLPRGPELNAWTLARARTLTNLHVQTCLLSGRMDNTSDTARHDWLERVKLACPRVTWIYTVSRTPAMRGILPASSTALEKFARGARMAGLTDVHVV